MKRTYLLLMLVCLNGAISAQQKDSTLSGGINDLLNKIGGIFGSSRTGTPGSLSTAEIVAGLKEALSVGTEKSTLKLASVDGFLKDAAVKILMPEEVRKIESRLRAVGMGRVFDQAVTSMNRAAEDA